MAFEEAIGIHTGHQRVMGGDSPFVGIETAYTGVTLD
jgi:hypothetical protein